MSTRRENVRLTPLADDMEQAHRYAAGAAAAGLRDAGPGPLRPAGEGVPVLAEAAVSSATPFVRAPLLSRLVPSPCPTAQELDL